MSGTPTLLRQDFAGQVGKWTLETIALLQSHGGIDAIVAAHNAALDAERKNFEEAVDYNERLSKINTQLRDQLAAERGRAENWKHNSERYEAELAAERKKREGIENRLGVAFDSMVADYQQQLDAEREKYNQAVDHLTQLGVETARKLEQQLAAEREKLMGIADEWEATYYRCEETLAAEREIKSAEKLILLDEVAKNKQLREQLAAEREKVAAAWRKGFDDGFKKGKEGK